MTMQQKILPPEFGEDESAPFKNDLLGRENEIKALTPMITRIASPAMMAIDAEWGAGKTAFIKMWKAHLNHEASARAFYFNAWETDFAADPLVPFVETITAQIEQQQPETKSRELKRKQLKDSAKALVPIIFGDLARKFAGDGLAKVAEGAAEGWFSHHDKITKFKDALENFAKTKTAEGVEVEERVVIFVDELDRCRPDYAVKVLERIKHLFEVPGVVFVLAIHRAQLCHAIKALYGAKFDADTYLHRFVEFDYTIKEPKMGDFISARLKGLKIENFLAGRKHREHNRDCLDLRETLELLAEIYRLNLRDMEQLLMRVVFVLWSLQDDAKNIYHFYPVLLAFLVVVRQKAPEQYRQYTIPSNTRDKMVAYWNEQVESAGILEGREDEVSKISIVAYIAASIILAKGSVGEDVINHYEKKGEDIAQNKSGWYFQRLATYIRDITRDFRREIDLQYLVRKIEMLDQFRFPDDDSTKGNGN